MDTILSAVRNLESFLQRELLRFGILGGVKKEVDLVRVQNVLMFLSFFKPTRLVLVHDSSIYSTQTYL